MHFSKTYKQEIRDFFDGKDYFGHHPVKGHVWVCHHDIFDTLTVEPLEGGQYEIAVRMKGKNEDGETVYKGYWAMEGFFVGHNTNGH